MTEFPLLDLKGSPGRIGLEHGRRLADKIEFARGFYLELISTYSGLDQAAILDRAARTMPLLQEHCPGLAEEMEAIASGAGQDPAVVLMLNARTELMSDLKPFTAECTTLGLEGSRTATGRTMLAQNWDWRPAMAPAVALFRIRPDEGPDVLTLAEAGQVAKVGFNSTGLGVLLNILFSSRLGTGIPIHVLLRMALGCGSVEEVLALLSGLPSGASSNFLLGDAAKVLTVELTPGRLEIIRSENGLVCHTNHFLNPTLARFDQGLALSPSSDLRLDRLTAILPGHGKWSVDEIKQLLTDHENKPLSICAHRNMDVAEYMRSATLASLIMEPGSGRLLCAAGQPCRNEYREYSL